MSRTIRRGPPPKRPAPRRKVPVKQVSVMDRLIGALPVGEDTLRRIVTWTITGIGGVAVLGAAVWAGVPGMIGGALAEGAGRAGFRVEQIDIVGLKRMDRDTVYALALQGHKDQAIFAIDLAEVRQSLLRYGWVADAHVSRRLPNTLLIGITERTPAAVWQDRGQLTLIDETGQLLDPVNPAAMPDLPLVIGPGADRQEVAYQALLAAAPALKPRIRAATWVGNRRWDLTFESGETLKLPEEGSAAALVQFAEKDGAHPLLGRGWLSFDMRDPVKLVARRPGASMAHRLQDDGAPAPTAEEKSAGRAGDDKAGNSSGPAAQAVASTSGGEG
ncbi:cell division protein FtsQ [Sphingomonas gellani]|uniref:Cell division protein FtsQ n=1 Tax=Sphingomonas gellani TaxID=1166340 RepID=A0A1H8FNY5_9SPHN|nr:cell division protein FtsQ/DivIB [Sphingomonas gellani]SEN33422.1 cell division protein FtsQ [Sphingomonas gellani]